MILTNALQESEKVYVPEKFPLLFWTKEPGVYGIIAGGNFEAESICLPGIWKEQAEKLGDDIIISIPTKDVVCYTKLNDKKLRKKMMGLAYSIFQKCQKENPDLIFCKDIFIYSREEEKITISSKYSLWGGITYGF